jgi:hypothetical protein
VSAKARAVFILLIGLFSASVYAGNELRSVRLSSCHQEFCTKIETEKIFRSDLQPGILSFADAKMVLVDLGHDEKILRSFEAADGYFDLRQQVIVLRNLKKSAHRELIYKIAEGRFLYF